MEHSQVLLNKQTHPLYVGGRRDQSFEDWDGKGSSVLLQASVVSDRYGAADLCWRIQDADIADFDRMEDTMPACRRVRARRTGVTRVSATLPDGAEASCVLTVIDSYARLTTVAIELNTDRLILAKGKEARLIPILYPKDLFENGMLNPALTWESDNEKAVSVREGLVHALSCGEANITVRSVDTGRTACCHITVRNDENVKAEGFDQIHAVQEITVGESLPLSAGNREVCWRSENRYVAYVGSHGVVFAASPSLRQTVGNHGLDRLTEKLLFQHLNFDFISESLLPKLYKDEGDDLMHVGPMAYDVVILPNLTTIRSTTLNALEQFHHQGGKIYFLGDAPSLVDAMPNDRAQRLAIESFRAKDIDDLCFQLEKYRTVSIENETGEQANNLLYQLRQDGQDQWLFLCHVYKTEAEQAEVIKITLPDCYSVETYDTLNGKTERATYQADKNQTVISCSLYGEDSALFRLTPTQQTNQSLIKKTIFILQQ